MKLIADVELRPVAENDLSVIYRLTNDPDATGEHEWFGWQDQWRYRRRWEQDGLLGDDIGVLMVHIARMARGGDIRGDEVGVAGVGSGDVAEGGGAAGNDGTEVNGAEALGFVSWTKRATARTSFCWSVGIAMLPEARGHGYGTAAQRGLVRYLFLHSQVNRIEAGTEVTNIAEQRALEKAGFTREGIARGGAFQGGRWHDAVIYSVLRSEVAL